MSQKNLLTCMLITANVGTIFEESALLELWFQQLKSYLTRVKPQFVAIHCQEVGGKNYESSMKHVSKFTKKILGDTAIIGDYTRVRIFLDENFENLENFTALGSLYLIHDSVQNVDMYNFKTAQYDRVNERKIYAGNSTNETADHMEKVKFPIELFPDCKWSRKGFMRTRWLFNDKQPVDFVNIHLFHDASNLIAMETTPSPYAQNRQRALEFALKRVSDHPSRPCVEKSGLEEKQQSNLQRSEIPPSKSEDQQVPLFIFGDFNFRLDTNKVIQRITEGVSPVVKRREDSDEILEFVYHRPKETVCPSSMTSSTMINSAEQTQEQRPVAETSSSVSSELERSEKIVMTIGKKLFDYENLDETFRSTENTEWLLGLDNELERFRDQLFEFKIAFNPSYPFKEDVSGGYSYMKTRCPSWCDRILFNSEGGKMIHSQDEEINRQPFGERRLELLQNQDDICYRLMGQCVPMGDHKPVLLYCKLNLNPTSESSSTSDQKTGGLIESTEM